MAYPGTCDDHDYDRILRLLDALKAAEAERDEARAALARVEALANAEDFDVEVALGGGAYVRAILRAALAGGDAP